MKNSFSHLISQYNSFLVLLPLRPDYDQVAAGLSLYLSLSQHKNVKDVRISCPTPMLVEVNRLVGVNKITQEVGNKNLVISFKDYKPDNVERVSYDIENSQFKLTIIPVPQVTPPSKDQIELTYTGILAECVILIGGDSDTSFPDIENKDLVNVVLMHVGIKDIVLTRGKQVLSFAQPKSSVSEVVASLIKETNLVIDSDIATNLLAGIENATNSFSSESLSGETFILVGELIQKGGRRLSKNVPTSLTSQEVMQGLPARRSQLPFTGLDPFMTKTMLQSNPLNSPVEFPHGESMKVNENDFQQGELESAPNDWFKPKIYKGTSSS